MNRKIFSPKGAKESHHQLFPDIFFVIFNTIFVKHINKFLLKRSFAMMVLLVFNILINSQKCKCASQNENSFFLSPFWGCLLLLFLRPGALPLAIPFLPFGHNNLRLVLGFAYAQPNLHGWRG